jgi:hypothetical protein
VSGGRPCRLPPMQRSFILRILVLCFALSGLASAADIFVYKGSVRTRGSLAIANAIPPVVRVYIVIDFDTGEARSITYFNKNGKRQLVNTSPFNVTRGTLPNSKTGTAIGYGNHSATSVNVFNFIAVLLQGTDVSLKIETQPAARIVSRPRVLTGNGLGTSSSAPADGAFQFSNYTLALQSPLTIDANNNNKTIETVIGEISAKLETQGYQLPVIDM